VWCLTTWRRYLRYLACRDLTCGAELLVAFACDREMSRRTLVVRRKKGSSEELPFLCLVTLAQSACYEGFLSTAMSACSICVY
jgi:hypothetical protein